MQIKSTLAYDQIMLKLNFDGQVSQQLSVMMTQRIGMSISSVTIQIPNSLPTQKCACGDWGACLHIKGKGIKQ